MPKLSEIPFDKIYIGLRVVSDNTGIEGEVVGKCKDFVSADGLLIIRDPEVDIKWDNGNESYGAWHHQLDKVTIKDSPTNWL